MGKYFVSPTEQPDWHLTPAEFVGALKRNWPEVRIVSETPDQYHSVEFELPLRYSCIDGSLDSAGDTLALDADARDAAAVAVWFRTIVPAQVPLILWDAGYARSVPVTASSDAGTLAATFMT